MKTEFEMVKEFHLSFQHPVTLSFPRPMPRKRIKARCKWIRDELIELRKAGNIIDQLDANLDALYFILGNFVEMGIDPTPFLPIVHHANMSKIWPDGKVHKDKDGKTIKPEGWEPPEPALKALMEKLYPYSTMVIGSSWTRGRAYQKRYEKTNLQIDYTPPSAAAAPSHTPSVRCRPANQ